MSHPGGHAPNFLSQKEVKKLWKICIFFFLKWSWKVYFVRNVFILRVVPGPPPPASRPPEAKWRRIRWRWRRSRRRRERGHQRTSMNTRTAENSGITNASSSFPASGTRSGSATSGGSLICATRTAEVRCLSWVLVSLICDIFCFYWPPFLY